MNRSSLRSWFAAVRLECRPSLMDTPFKVRPGKARRNYRVNRLFVHEYRCIAALAKRAGTAKVPLNCKTKPRAPGMMSGMAEPAHVPKSLRVLVSEGSSTSAREAITIPGPSGHIVEVCDPSRYGLARFSRFVAKFHRCPGLRDDPAGFLRFVEALLAARHFDVLLPIHEQGFLFARMRQRLENLAGLALPGFDSYRTAHSKAGFSRLLDRLRLPQPATRIVTSAAELREVIRFPSVVKTSI